MITSGPRFNPCDCQRRPTGVNLRGSLHREAFRRNALRLKDLRDLAAPHGS
jgi:hypothetical protein